MGVLSALVVSACVAPPMARRWPNRPEGQSARRDRLSPPAPESATNVGGGARFLTHAVLDDVIKALFENAVGVAVDAVASCRALTLALWGLLVIVGGYYFGGFGRASPSGNAGAVRGFGLAAIVWGILMLVGAAAGGRDDGQPLRGATLPGLAGARPAAGSESLPFRKIASVDDLDRELEAAQAAGKPAMLDFYADWCVSCKEMEKYTFSLPEVQKDLSGFVLLKADVTANNEADQALLRRFGVYGPPTTAFFGSHGGECRPFRLVGFVKADAFRSHLARFAREC